MHYSRFLVVLLALVALPALPVRAATTFTDPQGRFSVLLPDGWQQDTTASSPGLIVQYLTTNPNGAFNIAQRVSARLQQQYSDYQQTNSSPASVAGEQGVELACIIHKGGKAAARRCQSA